MTQGNERANYSKYNPIHIIHMKVTDVTLIGLQKRNNSPHGALNWRQDIIRINAVWDDERMDMAQKQNWFTLWVFNSFAFWLELDTIGIAGMLGIVHAREFGWPCIMCDLS